MSLFGRKDDNQPQRRSNEERERARLEREARRRQRTGEMEAVQQPAPAPRPPEPEYEPEPVQPQTAITAQPSERSLRDPALGQQDESLDTLWPRDNFQLVMSIVGQPAIQVMIVILLIRPHQSQPGKIRITQLLQNFRSGLGIVDVARGHHHGEQQTHTVYDNMTFAAPHFFAGIVADRLAALAGFHRLAVDAGSAGGALAAFASPNQPSPSICPKAQPGSSKATDSGTGKRCAAGMRSCW